MSKKKSFVLGYLLTGATLVACQLLQTSLDAQATSIAADVFATQTAEAPTPTSTPTVISASSLLESLDVDALSLYRDFNQAIKELTAAINVEPDNAELYYLRGTVYYGRYQAAYEANDSRADGTDFYRAITDFTKVIELDHTHAKAYSFRGLTYAGLDRSEHALADYNQAIELDPELPTTYYGRAFLFEEMGETELAIADYTRFLELSDDSYWRAEAEKRLKALEVSPP